MDKNKKITRVCKVREDFAANDFIKEGWELLTIGNYFPTVSCNDTKPSWYYFMGWTGDQGEAKKFEEYYFENVYEDKLINS